MKKPIYSSSKKRKISSTDYRTEIANEFLINEKDLEIKPKKNNDKN